MNHLIRVPLNTIVWSTRRPKQNNHSNLQVAAYFFLISATWDYLPIDLALWYAALFNVTGYTATDFLS